MDDGEPNHEFKDPKALFHQQYFEAIDFGFYEDLKHRFQQESGMPVAATLENILLKAANGDVSEEYQHHLHLYSKDINIEQFLKCCVI